MPGKVFISYRRDDSAPHALSVAQYLEKRFGAKSVFIDVDRIRAGENFPAVLDERLSQSKVMLVILGPHWTDARDAQGRRRLDDPDDWVRLEIETALRQKVRVIPVLVGGAALPSEAELATGLKPLIKMQAAVITTTNFRHEMAGLANDIEFVIGRDYSKFAKPAALAGVLAVLLLTVIYFALERSGSSRSSGEPVLTAKCQQELEKFHIAAAMGAFAVSSNGNCGSSSNLPKIAAARVAALEACGKNGPNCKVVETIAGDWTMNSACETQFAAWRSAAPAKAFALSRSGHCSWSVQQKSAEQAKAQAVAQCENFASDCRIRESDEGNWQLTDNCKTELNNWKKAKPIRVFVAARNGECASSWGYDNLEEAKKVALADCEGLGSDCKVLESFQGEWAVSEDCKPELEKWQRTRGRGAFAVGQTDSCGYSYSYSNAAEADSRALSECQSDGGSNCRIIARK